jgi:hypothetical protein
MKLRTLTLIGLVLLLVLLLGVLVRPNVAAQIVQRDTARDLARFTPGESVDIAMAMKLVTHDPPKMLAPPEPQPVQLLFPPSAVDLERLSGV